MTQKERAKKSADGIAADLRLMAELLQRNGVLTDASPLMAAASECSDKIFKPNGSDEYRWQYVIPELEFVRVSLECLRNGLPANISHAHVKVSVTASGNCQTSFLADPLLSLAVNIIVVGKQNGGKDLLSAWHLDRHITSKKDNEPKYIHPLYHFQYGGKEISTISRHGEHILLNSPRLPHPPLDGILSIDFVLSNYYGEHWSKLREDATYQKIVEASQKRLWEPYTRSIASRWFRPAPPFSNWKYRENLPQLFLIS